MGFANNLVSKKATVILKNGSTTLELPMNVDPTKIYSKKLKMKTGADDNPALLWTGSNYSDIIEDTPEFDGVNELNPIIKLPEDMQEGEWKVYMRISHYGDYKTDNNYHVIQFANDTNYFDKVTGSNYLGKFTLSKSTYVDPGEFPPSSSSEAPRSSSSGHKVSDEWFSSSSLVLELPDSCITFVKGAGGYGDNCYKDGLDSMTVGKCYTLNTGRDLETVAIPKKANNSFYWREFDCGSWKEIKDSIETARNALVRIEKRFDFKENVHLSVFRRSIQITGMTPNTSVVLMDLQGRTISRIQSSKSSCDLNVSRSGKYILRLGSNLQMISVK